VATKKYYRVNNRWITLCTIIALLPAGCVSFAGKDAFRLEKDGADVYVYSAEAREGSGPLLRYRYAEVPFKSYVREFCTPAGINLLRDAPHDHLHHHALMLGIAVDGVNFWTEYPDSGKQVHRKFTARRQDRHQGLCRALVTDYIDWTNTAGDKAVIHEYRTIEIYSGKDLGASLLTWDSQFELLAGKTSALITGGRYYGLGVRFVEPMDKQGDYINADGKKGVEGTNAASSPWCAYRSKVEGKPVTVAMFDHPQNPRHPATWFTMQDKFSYISATLNLKNEPFKTTSDNPLRLCYGLALWDGHVKAATIDKLYKRWIELSRAN